MVTQSDLVLLVLAVILASSGSYRNNNNVIVVHSKVERMKGKAAAIFAVRCRIKNKFCKFNYLNSTVIRATATLILQNSSGELRTVRITLGPCKAADIITGFSAKAQNTKCLFLSFKPQPQVYQIVNF